MDRNTGRRGGRPAPRGSAGRNAADRREPDRPGRGGAPGKERRTPAPGFRIGLVGVVFSAVLLVNLGIIGYFKTVKGADYELRARNQLIERKGDQSDIAPLRGSIVDRNGSPFVMSYPTKNIFIDITKLCAQEEEVRQNSVRLVNEYLGISEAELWKMLETTTALDEEGNLVVVPVNPTNYKVVARDISTELAKRLISGAPKGGGDEKAKPPKFVFAEDSSVRTFSSGKLASSIIGFRRGEALFGLENQYDSYLSGAPGRSFRTYEGQTLGTETIPAINGATVVTTLDAGLQQAAEDIAVKYGEQHDAENTAVVIMSAKTGEIYAAAQYPTFDGSNPTDILGITKTSLRNDMLEMGESELYDNLNRVWNDFLINYTLEPGSIFKPITVAAALEENIISPDSKYYCPGGIQVEDRWINCWKHEGHGSQTLEESLANSCNVAMTLIAQEMGRKIFHDYQKAFGFGETTGIDLPAEVSARSLVYALSELNPVQLSTSSFGQRFNATPMQCLMAFAAAINGGNLLEPHVVSKVVSPDGKILLSNEITINNKVISKETSDYIRKSLESTMISGTGKKAYIPGYAIGGKTGTSELGVAGSGDYGYLLSFVGYLPVDDPEYVVMTMIHRPSNYVDGVTSVAPMFKETVEMLIKLKSIPPSYDINLTGESYAGAGMVECGSYIGQSLADVTRSLNQKNLNYGFVGGGAVVVSQFPTAGTKMSPGATVTLTLGNGEGYELTTIPVLKGLTKDEASAMLIAARLVPVFLYPEGEGREDAAAGDDKDAFAPIYIVETQFQAKDTSVMVGTELRLMMKKLQ